jgi:general L-amino acid transport system permease protein
MATVEAGAGEGTARRRTLPLVLYDPRLRALAVQVLVVALLAWLAYGAIHNAIVNLRSQNIASGFDFLWRTAGFDISQTPIAYKNTDTYFRAFLVGLTNTLIVAVLGIVIATLLGFLVAVARLSPNWLVARLGTVYIEIVRNVPPLLQLFVWYFAVLKALPPPRQSLELPFGSLLNVRGLYVPAPTVQPGATAVLLALAAALAIWLMLGRWAARRRRQTGAAPRIWPIGLALAVVLPGVAVLAWGAPVAWTAPILRGFNVAGGLALQPEFVALLAGLSVYMSAFIAENIRSGLEGVPKGQKEAAAALGLSRAQTLRLVTLPQALRIVVPPLTSQYLNLTKNSSLAVAIGYPDLVSVFSGTVLHQTNQALEVIFITMCVYLFLSLATAAAMNWFNARYAIPGR